MTVYQHRIIASFVGAMALVCAPMMAAAAILKDEKGLAWASNRDLTSQQFSQRFDSYRDRGFMMIDIDAYPTSRGIRYSMIWRENTDGRGWAEHRGLTSDGYNDRWRQYRDRGFRPHDIETWTTGSGRRWAGIWVENREGLRWSSHRGLTHEAYGDLFDEKSDDGFRLLDMEAYQTGSGMRYAAIWIENKDNRPWAQLRNMTRQRYQQEVDARSANGFRVVDYEAYQTPTGLRYAAIWERKPGFAWQTRTNRTRTQFANLWRQYRDEGYRLVDFERYETSSGPRYAGVWAENAARFRHPAKGDINTLVSDYQSDNGFPGVSVAVIHNGSMIYRRGFGDADIDAGKKAHGETIYGLASVSKAIGGTLAAKLEDEGRIRNGTTFNLDLGDLTSDYLTNIPVGGGQTVSLPNQHIHTVEQLLSHQGCVVHYQGSTSPGFSNTTSHFSNAVAASQLFWSLGLVTDRDVDVPGNDACLVGGNVGQRRSYSTHAFTLVGAVLERVTGRTIAQLVDGELVDQYNLGTMRTMYSSSNLPSNYDRARHYTSATNEVGYQNNSWKVLGGGIESSAVDLARFGWKVLNGEIVDAQARDCRMWTPIPNVNRNGLGWDLSTSASRRVAQHGGDARGMDSYIRIYRDEGLVIAILANRNVDSSPRGTLAANIATEVLGSTVTPPQPVSCIATPGVTIQQIPQRTPLEPARPQRPRLQELQRRPTREDDED